ncbi:MAG: acyltransferase [Betaproteobacteria bacterium]
MRSRATRHVDGLTGLRGIAAISVLLYHCWGVSGLPMTLRIGSQILDFTPLFASGWMGVDLFFVLSAFLLGQQAMSRDDYFSGSACGDYLKRRIWRVFPAYYAQFLVILMLVAAGAHQQFSTENALAHLLMAQNFCERSCPSIVYVWWSLPVEFDFYLLLPLLVIPLARTGAWKSYAFAALGVGLAIEYLILAVLPFDYRGQIHQLPARLTEFGGGLAAAKCWAMHRDRLVRYKEWLFIGGVVTLVVWFFVVRNRLPIVAAFENHWLTYALRPALTLGFVLIIIAAAAKSRATEAILANPPVHLLGVVSYSLYLWHTIPLYWLRDHNYFNSWGLGERFIHTQVLLYTVPAALTLASASYLLVERPFLPAGQRFGPWSNFEIDPVWRGRLLIGVGALCLAATFVLNSFNRP